MLAIRVLYLCSFNSQDESCHGCGKDTDAVLFLSFVDDSPVAWTSVIWQTMWLAQFVTLFIAPNVYHTA